MQRVKSAHQAQRFLSDHNRIYFHFQLHRHLISATEYCVLREAAFRAWRDVTRAAAAA
jgi:putative transposase